MPGSVSHEAAAAAAERFIDRDDDDAALLRRYFREQIEHERFIRAKATEYVRRSEGLRVVR